MADFAIVLLLATGRLEPDGSSGGTDTEGHGDLLSYPRTAVVWVPLLHLDDCHAELYVSRGKLGS
jgi:hypothetical protein